MKGKGHEEERNKFGDLYVKINIDKGLWFERDDNDIIDILEIKMSESVLGTTKIIETIHGEEKLVIPEGTKHDDILSLKNKGVYNELENRLGDHKIKIKVKMISKLTEE